jgi:hypothetical protein
VIANFFPNLTQQYEAILKVLPPLSLGPAAQLCALGMSLMAYSGFTREQLAAREDAARLLFLCDVLVDGPFREERHDPGLSWRGSSNQRILRLTARYSEDDLAQAMAAQGRASAVSGSPAGQTAISGFQEQALARF